MLAGRDSGAVPDITGRCWPVAAVKRSELLGDGFWLVYLHWLIGGIWSADCRLEAPRGEARLRPQASDTRAFDSATPRVFRGLSGEGDARM